MSNALLDRVTEVFSQKQRSAAEQYWSAIADSKSDPELVMTLADKMGKNLNDLREDSELIEQFNQTAKPDGAKFKAEIKKLTDKRAKIHAELEKLHSAIQSKKLELDVLSNQAHGIQSEFNNAERGYQQLLKRLSSRGHPTAMAATEEAQQAKQEAREQRLYERRESDLIQELAQCDKDIARIEALPKLSEYDQNKLGELKAKRAKLDAELTKHREHG